MTSPGSPAELGNIGRQELRAPCGALQDLVCTVQTLVDKNVPHVPLELLVLREHPVHKHWSTRFCQPMFLQDLKRIRQDPRISFVDQCFSGTQANDRSNSTPFFLSTNVFT